MSSTGTPSPPPGGMPVPPPAEPSGPRAGFDQRLGAYLLDVLFVMLFAIALSIALLAVAGPDVAFGLGFTLTILLLMPAYWTILEGGRNGQTLGKRMVGIRVIDQHTGGPIGPGRAFVRILVRVFRSAAAYLGYRWMLWDPERQTRCLHTRWTGRSRLCAPRPPLRSLMSPRRLRSRRSRLSTRLRSLRSSSHPDDAPPAVPR